MSMSGQKLCGISTPERQKDKANHNLETPISNNNPETPVSQKSTNVPVYAAPSSAERQKSTPISPISKSLNIDIQREATEAEEVVAKIIEASLNRQAADFRPSHFQFISSYLTSKKNDSFSENLTNQLRLNFQVAAAYLLMTFTQLLIELINKENEYLRLSNNETVEGLLSQICKQFLKQLETLGENSHINVRLFDDETPNDDNNYTAPMAEVNKKLTEDGQHFLLEKNQEATNHMTSPLNECQDNKKEAKIEHDKVKNNYIKSAIRQIRQEIISSKNACALSAFLHAQCKVFDREQSNAYKQLEDITEQVYEESVLVKHAIHDQSAVKTKAEAVRDKDKTVNSAIKIQNMKNFIEKISTIRPSQEEKETYLDRLMALEEKSDEHLRLIAIAIVADAHKNLSAEKKSRLLKQLHPFKVAQEEKTQKLEECMPKYREALQQALIPVFEYVNIQLEKTDKKWMRDKNKEKVLQNKLNTLKRALQSLEKKDEPTHTILKALQSSDAISKKSSWLESKTKRKLQEISINTHSLFPNQSNMTLEETASACVTYANSIDIQNENLSREYQLATTLLNQVEVDILTQKNTMQQRWLLFKKRDLNIIDQRLEAIRKARSEISFLSNTYEIKGELIKLSQKESIIEQRSYFSKMASSIWSQSPTKVQQRIKTLANMVEGTTPQKY